MNRRCTAQNSVLDQSHRQLLETRPAYAQAIVCERAQRTHDVRYMRAFRYPRGRRRAECEEGVDVYDIMLPDRLHQTGYKARCHLVWVDPLVCVDAVRSIHDSRCTRLAIGSEIVVRGQCRHLDASLIERALHDADRSGGATVAWRYRGDD